MDGKFKVQVQDCDLEYFFVDLTRRIALSEKKLPLIKVLIQIVDIDIRLKRNGDKLYS